MDVQQFFTHLFVAFWHFPVLQSVRNKRIFILQADEIYRMEEYGPLTKMKLSRVIFMAHVRRNIQIKICQDVSPEISLNQSDDLFGLCKKKEKRKAQRVRKPSGNTLT